MNISDLEINISDASAKEFSEEVIEQLEKFYDDIETFSMNESQLFLEGQKDMLGIIIGYLRNVKPQ